MNGSEWFVSTYLERAENVLTLLAALVLAVITLTAKAGKRTDIGAFSTR